MALTPRDVREIEFAERLRGYNPDLVDEFLERVALRIEELESEAEKWRRRSDTAEARLAEASADSEVLHRTLVMAQRTADETIREAERRAESIVQDAEARSASIISDAEFEARRRMAESTSEIRSEVARLMNEREDLAGHLVRLRERLGSERSDAVAFYRQGIEWLAEHIPAPSETDDLAEIIEAARHTASDLAVLMGQEEPPAEQPAPAQEQAAAASESADPASAEPETVPWQLPGHSSSDPDMTSVMPAIKVDEATPGAQAASGGDETRALRLDDLEQMDQPAHERR